MKVLQASKAYFPHIGGVETVARQLAEGFVAEGWRSEVLVAAEGRGSTVEEIGGVTVRRASTLARALSLPLCPGYPRALRRAEADVLVVHEPSLLPSSVLWADRRSWRRRFDRIVVWWHSDIVRQSAFVPFFRPVLEHLLDIADVVVAATPHHVSVSPYLQRVRDKVAIVPYGVEWSRFRDGPARPDLVEAHRRRAGGRALVSFAGRLVGYKGIAELIAAFERVPDAHLVVAGDGPDRVLVSESRLYREGRVSLLGRVSQDELDALYWASDAFVLPSVLRSEMFGLVQLDAMACATPVVTFDLPTGVTWVNRHEQTGLVAPLGSVSGLAAAINRLVAEPDLAARLGQNARCRVERCFDVTTMLRKTAGLCRGDDIGELAAVRAGDVGRGA